MPLSRVRGVCHACPMSHVRGVCHARVMHSVRVLAIHKPHVRVFGVMHDPCVRVGVTHYHVGSCASHVLLMCFSCVSHVFLMCFSCVSHVCLMCASCVSQSEAGV